jgi:hypothetical protein
VAGAPVVAGVHVVAGMSSEPDASIPDASIFFELVANELSQNQKPVSVFSMSCWVCAQLCIYI